MEKIKIMAVAPYESLQDLLYQIAKNRTDIDLRVFLGDLSKGVEHVHAAYNTGYEVILSRGGTAEMIQQMADVAVVEIGVSGFDVLRSIRLAQNYSGSFAIVGFASITSSAKTLCDLLQYKIDIFTIKSESEVENCLVKLARNGFTMLIGDTVVVDKAKTLGLGGILIASGPESVSLSMDNAVNLGRLMRKSNRHAILYRNVLSRAEQQIVVFEQSGNSVFSNFSMEGNTSIAINKLKKHIPAVLSKGDIGFSLKEDNSLWFVKASNINDYVAFYVKKALEKYDGEVLKAINYYELVPDPLESFYGNPNILNNTSLKARMCGEYSKPVFIRGERGVGKETIAKIVHLNSSFKENPMAIVDCSMVSEKKWDPLIDGKNSLRVLEGFSIFIKNIQCISTDIQKKLEGVLSNTSLSRNNRLIFSETETQGNNSSSHLREYILNSTGCVTICPIPLRERKKDIPSLVSLYIGSKNQKLTSMVIGFEKNAMELMKQFNWPQNITQLKRVLNELLLLTKKPYVPVSDVEHVLNNEEKFYKLSDQPQTFQGTLDEIIKCAIHAALTAENMNQTKAAKRLGICRSTMWKRLKNE
jgi:transcriptional regulator with PAS, ATPase and Fis domain